MIDISKIRTDGGTQSRAEISESTVSEYAEAMADPDTIFPPVVVYHDGKDYWLADGFHRLAAWARIGRVEVPADVRQGDRRRAILHSCVANSTHGLRRTNADKRRAVLTLLEDEEWSGWSNREIARRCGVSDYLVAGVRESLTASSCSEDVSEPRIYTTKHGTTAEMKTSNIGKNKPDDESGISSDDTEEGAGSKAQKTAPAKEPPDPLTKARKALAKLTREALEDEVIGLRDEVTDLRKAKSEQKAEIADLKTRIKAFEQDDIGRALGNAQRQEKAARGQLMEQMAANKRLEFRLKKSEEQVKELEKQEIAL